MKVSIVTATYNSSQFLIDTYKSIISQNYPDWEWIVTDDASTDNTVRILLDLAKDDSRIKVFVNNVNSGAAISRNNSLDYVSGEFIAFIDSDDIWFPDKLTRQVKFMIENNLGFTFTAYELVSAQGLPLNRTVDTSNSGFFNYHDMLMKKATLGCSTVILKSSIVHKLRMPLIRTGQDYAFWLLVLRNGVNAHIYPEILTSYRINNNSISRNKFKKALRQWEIYRRLENISFVKSFYYFTFYAFRAVFRKG